MSKKLILVVLLVLAGCNKNCSGSKTTSNLNSAGKLTIADSDKMLSQTGALFECLKVPVPQGLSMKTTQADVDKINQACTESDVSNMKKFVGDVLEACQKGGVQEIAKVQKPSFSPACSKQIPVPKM